MISTNSAKSKFQANLKILFLGNEQVGKTAIISKFINNQFIDQYRPSKGYDFRSKTFDIEEGSIQLEIWDCAGQDKLKYKEFPFIQVKDYQAAIICYDITNEKSFQSVSYWVEVVKKEKKNNALIFCIGCKCDFEEKRMVSTDQAMAVAQQHEAEFLELSARNSEAVYELFQLISQSILKQFDENNETQKLYKTCNQKQKKPLCRLQ